MWLWINETLEQFKTCFNNKRTYGWFVIIIIELMIRTYVWRRWGVDRKSMPENVLCTYVFTAARQLIVGGKTNYIIEESHVVKMIKDAGRVSKAFGKTLLLLGRLYLTVPILMALGEEPLIKVVTKAKINAKAFYHPKTKTGRGAKPKKGEKVKVASIFETWPSHLLWERTYVRGSPRSKLLL